MTSPNGPGGAAHRPLSAAQVSVDHVIRMREFLASHPEVSWLRPGQAGVAQHTATWTEPDPDPEKGETAVTVSRVHLGWLVEYLEARFGR
jgi:hypothetical protein